MHAPSALLSLLIIACCTAFAEPGPQYAVKFDPPDHDWFPALYSNYIIEGDLKAYEIIGDAYLLELKNTVFLRGVSFSNSVSVRVDFSEWFNVDENEWLQVALEDNGVRLVIHCSEIREGHFMALPFDLILTEQIGQYRQLSSLVISLLSMAEEGRLELLDVNVNADAKISVFKLFNKGNLESSVRELRHFGRASFIPIYNQLDDYRRIERSKLSSQDRQSGFYKVFRPLTYHDLFDSLLFSMVGHRPYYPVGNQATKWAMAASAWKVFIWLDVHGEKSLSDISQALMSM